MENRRIGPDGGFIREFKDWQKRVQSIESKPAGKITIRETLTTVDPETGVKTILGELPDGSYGIQPFVYDITPPPVSSTPAASAEPGLFAISWDGTFVDGADQPRDFVAVNVIGHKIVNGTTASSIPVGRMTTAAKIYVSTDVVAVGETWEFSLEAEDYNGNRAEWSARSVPLVMKSLATDVAVETALTDLQTSVQTAQEASDAAQEAAGLAQGSADDAAQAALDATNLASGKSKVHYNPVMPPLTGNTLGDMWVDIDDSYALYSWSGSAWVKTQDSQEAIDLASTKIRSFVQASEPVGTTVGDIWMDTDNKNELFRWSGSAWVSYRDLSILDADAKAAQAIADAATAQDIADGKVATYFQSGQPTGQVAADVGDLWFDTDDGNKMWRWTGSAWVVADDQRIASAVTAAANAKTIADSKITTLYQDAEPSATGRTVGDLWVDTNDQNKLYRWSGSVWQSARDLSIASASNSAAAALEAAQAAQTAADSAQAVADGAIRTFYQSAAPTGLNNTTNVGDLWFDTDDDQAYRWSGAAWILIQDNAIATALAAAQNAQTTADGKITSFYQPGQPATGEVGDLWFDTDDKNKPYYCSSTAPLTWTQVRDGAINDAQSTANTALTSANGKNKTYYQTGMPSGGTYILGDTWVDTDDANKLYVHNGTTFVSAQDGAIGAASSLATSKGKVLIQSTVPVAADQLPQNLWIDTTGGLNTPKRWNTTLSRWDAVTDKVATDAATAAATAQTKADQAFNNAATAATAAGDAQTTADGKNRSWYTNTAPAGTAHKIGDLWFNTGAGYKLSTWTGTIWQTTQDAALAQITAESKGRTYTQNFAPPADARLPQNLWIDTSAGVNLSVTKYWDGSAWTPVKDAEINAAELRAAQDAKAKADAAANAAINAQAYSLNASFDDWPTALPALYTSFGSGPTKETTTVLTGPNAARFNCTDTTTDRGLNFNGILDRAPNLEYFTVELKFRLVSGTSLSGAGVLLDWTGMTNNRATVSLTQEVPTPVTGKWYTISKVLRRPTNATGTWTVMDGYLMANYSGITSFGAKSVKDVIFDWLNIRPSTAEEILAYNAPTTQYVDQAETDAINAAAQTAQTKADAARDAAIADTTTRLVGKNKVVWSLSAATGTEYTAGDTWFQRDGTGAVIAQWEFDTAWRTRTVSETVLGNLSAAKISYGVMSGERIEANTISVDKLLVMSTDNLISEPTFTAGGIAWANTGAYSVDPVGARNGGPAWKITNAATQQGVYNKPDKIPVEEGQSYRVVAYIKSDVAIPVAMVALYVSTRTAAGAASTVVAGSTGSASQDIVGTIPANTWTRIVGVRTVPAGHVNISFGIFSQSGFSTGSVWVDFVSATRMSGGELIVDGSIDGKVITAPTIQTHTGTTTGIKLTPTELQGWDGTNKNFSLTSGGSLYLKGEIKSGSTIEGARITGTQGIETSVTPLTGVKVTNTGIKAYDAGNNLSFHLDAGTGLLEVPGIKANSLNGDTLVSGSVTTRELRIGDFSNLITNGFGDLGAGIGFGSALIYDTADRPSGVTAAFRSTAGQGTYTPSYSFVDVDPNTEYITEIWLKADKPNSRIYVELRDQAASLTSGNTLIFIDGTATNTSQGSYQLSSYIVPTVWTKYTVRVITSATTTKLRVGAIYFNHPNGTERTATISMAMALRRRLGGNLIVDGAITTNHMTSGTINAGILSAGSIKSPMIEAKSIGVDRLTITSTDNLVVGGDMALGAASWQKGTYITANASAGRGSLPTLRFTGSVAAQTSLNLSNKITVDSDNKFRGSIFVKSSAALAIGKVRLMIRCYTTATAYTDIEAASNTTALVVNTWTQVQGISPALPAGTVAVEFYLNITNPATGTVTDIDYVSVTRAADGTLIVDGAITAKKMETELVLASKIIAGSPDGTYAEMSPLGFKVFADAIEPGAPSTETVRLGVASTDDYFAITDTLGRPLATISQTGLGSFQEVTVKGDLSYKGEELTTVLDRRPRGIRTYGYLASGAFGPSEIGLGQVHFIAEKGRAYRVHVRASSTSYALGGTTVMTVRTSNSGTPTISSTSLYRNESLNNKNEGFWHDVNFSFIWYPNVAPAATPNALSWKEEVLVTARNNASSPRNETIYDLEISIEDIGLTAMTTMTVNNGGGTLYQASAPPTVAAKTTYVKRWETATMQNYQGNNTPYPLATSQMYQGQSPAGYGNLKSIALFGTTDNETINMALSGATINHMRVYFNFTHWYYNSGGTARIGVMPHNSVPSSFTYTGEGQTGGIIVSSGGWPKPGARWIDIPSDQWNNWKNGVWKGVSLEGDSSYGTYGIADKPTIEISYTK